MKKRILLLVLLSLSITVFSGNKGKDDTSSRCYEIQRYDVIIYTAPFCGACQKAKAILTLNDINFVERSMLFYNKDRKERLRKTGGDNTAPQLFINGQFIGSLNKLRWMEKEGWLMVLKAKQTANSVVSNN